MTIILLWSIMCFSYFGSQPLYSQETSHGQKDPRGCSRNLVVRLHVSSVVCRLCHRRRLHLVQRRPLHQGCHGIGTTALLIRSKRSSLGAKSATRHPPQAQPTIAELFHSHPSIPHLKSRKHPCLSSHLPVTKIEISHIFISIHHETNQ